MNYYGRPDFQHGSPDAVGLLFANLGTPDAPTTPALRRYLREFLLDPRVIELPRLTWWLILHLFILPRRPKQSAKLYQQVWTPEGSPLLLMVRRQAAAVAEILGGELGTNLQAAVGMRYGNPSIRSALRELAEKGCRRILVLPLYPQYAAATSASTFDAVARELQTWRWVPELRVIQHYHDDPGYVAALAASIRETWAGDPERGPAEKLLFSFHGIPRRYFESGDPYFCHCHQTARLVAEALALPADRWQVSFQSLFGKEEWIKPYTDKTVEGLAHSGVRSLDVICPGFSADCLETLEEIDGLNREIFLHHGGERFRYVPALNDRPDHLRMLAGLIRSNLTGWVTPEDWTKREATRTRAETMKLRYPAPADGSRPQG
jgi:ferrochelatase